MDIKIQNILIIDDNEDYRNALMVRLRNLYPDANIVEYDYLSRGFPAADFDWEKYDVLLLDYYLGDKETGLQWFQRCDKTDSFPATVILTGLDNEGIAAQVLKSGVHHYMSKTHLTKGELYKGIEKAMQVRARRQLLSTAKGSPSR